MLWWYMTNASIIPTLFKLHDMKRYLLARSPRCS